MLNKKEISEISSNDDTLSHLQIDRNFITSARDSVTASIDNDSRSVVSSIPGDKLHRRNPVTVRQEIQSFDDIITETTLSDLQLNEMPGLQNTEQWKRIAGRMVHASPPISRQYCQTAACIFEPPNDNIPDVLGSYCRTGIDQETPSTIVPSLFRTSRRKILFSLIFIATIATVLTAVIVAVVLVRKPRQVTTDYYSGSIYVRARFDPVLFSQSSTLVKNYQREFCSLIGTTLADTKTKYAIFYSACSVNAFRNGSIIGDFILGFTRYQNVTRLNTFLNRTLMNKQLFGGTILGITFNSTTATATDSTDYEPDYNINDMDDLFSTQQNSY